MSLIPDFILSQNLYPIISTCFVTILDVNYLITGDEKGSVTFWDLFSYKKSFLKSDAHDSRIISIQSDANRKLILTQSRGEIKIWNFIENPLNLYLKRIYNSSTVSLSTCCLLNLTCGDYMIATCSTGDSKIVNLHHSKEDSVINLSSRSSNGLLMVIKLICYESGSQILLLSGYEDGTIKCHSITLSSDERIINTKELSLLTLFKDMITSLDFDEKSLKGVCGSVDSKLIIFTINREHEPYELTVLKSIDIGNQGISSIKIRSDNRLICISCWDSRVKLFSWKTLKLLAVLDKHQQTINSISFSDKLSGSGKFLLAIASNDKTVSLWSPYSDI